MACSRHKMLICKHSMILCGLFRLASRVCGSDEPLSHVGWMAPFHTCKLLITLPDWSETLQLYFYSNLGAHGVR